MAESPADVFLSDGVLVLSAMSAKREHFLTLQA
jgi:hypothetical protein